MTDYYFPRSATNIWIKGQKNWGKYRNETIIGIELMPDYINRQVYFEAEVVISFLNNNNFVLNHIDLHTFPNIKKLIIIGDPGCFNFDERFPTSVKIYVTREKYYSSRAVSINEYSEGKILELVR